jgi:two-component system response regulator FixJ
MTSGEVPASPEGGILGDPERCGRGRTVHVIDDDEAVRRAVAMLLKSAGISVATHPSGLAFLDALPGLGENAAGCVLTDIQMPGLDGIELLRRLRELHFRWPLVVMTAHGDIPTAVRAMKAGAADFIEKPFDDVVLLATIATALASSGPSRAAAAAEAAPPGNSAGADAAEAAARIAALSPREREVLDLLMTGKPNKAIARDLGLSPRTVEVHRARLMARLGTGSLAEAVRLAVRAELGRRASDDGVPA